MPRVQPVDPAQATGRARELLEELAARGGQPGAMTLTMANAPAVLSGYLGLSCSLKRAHLDRRVSERVSLAVQQWLGCELCIAAHSEAARRVGLGDHDIELARMGSATERRTALLIAFALQVLAAPGEITDGDIADLRDAGWTHEQILEVVALVSLNHLTGAFNLVAGLHHAEVV